MAMSPAALAKILVLANPEFVMAGSASARNTLLAYAMDTQSYSELIQYLQTYPEESAAVSAALQPGAHPSIDPVPLPDGMVDALWAVWTETETVAFADESLEGLCWWMLEGLTPGIEVGGPADGRWKLEPFSPTGLVALPSIAYADEAFRVTLKNMAPRHVCGYARFLSNGFAVEPDGWISRLPAGVPKTFESATTKYLGRFAPQVAVSGFALGASAQTLSLALPANADTLAVAFGGLGNRRFDSLECAGGLGLTYWLDFTAAWFASRFPAAKGTESWFVKLLGDDAICNAVMAVAGSLLGVADTLTALETLAAQGCSTFLGSGLNVLRQSIDKQFGEGSAAAYASTVGWSAQIVAAGLKKQPQTQAWVSAVDAAASLPLAPSSSIEVQVAVLPDPGLGTFPFALAQCEVALAYGGFSQRKTFAVSLAEAAHGTLAANFGSVRNVGPIEVSVRLLGATGTLLAEGTTHVAAPAFRRDRVVRANVTTVELRTAVTATTKFARLRSLIYLDNKYVWDTGQLVAAGASGVTGYSICVAQRAQSVGYVWNTSKHAMPNCAGQGTVSAPYLMQAVGTMVPGNELKTMSCGFVLRPALGYDVSDGMFLDPRVDPPALRDVNLAAGPFDLANKLARGRFSSILLDAVAVSAGYAIAVSSTLDRMEIVRLAEVAVEDPFAPLALVVGGSGDRIGLLSAPVAVAITSEGTVLVLERGNRRIQAFDLAGNSLGIFDGQPVTPVSGEDLRDLAIGPANYLYVLSEDRIEILNASGSHVCEVTGVSALRIAVDTRGLIYTLDESGIVGPGGFVEPGLAVWGPV